MPVVPLPRCEQLDCRLRENGLYGKGLGPLCARAQYSSNCEKRHRQIVIHRGRRGSSANHEYEAATIQTLTLTLPSA